MLVQPVLILEASGAKLRTVHGRAVSRGLPFAALRAVSDGAERCLPKAVSVALRPDGNTDVMAVLRSVLAEPAQVPALIHTALEARAGLRALRRSVAVLRGSGV